MSQYYIRIRGRVQGPYQIEQIQSLIQKGILSRIHEISQDQQSWVKAANYPELFNTASAPAAAEYAAPAQTPEFQSAQPQYSTGSQIPATQLTEVQWYFNHNGNQQGPVNQSQLTQMLASGQLSLETPVWCQGMQEWLRARQIHLFANIQTNPYQSSSIGQNGGSNYNQQVSGQKYCYACGNLLVMMAELCPKCGVRQGQPVINSNYGHHYQNRKDRTTAMLLALLLGWIGAHHFYLGNLLLGIIYLIFSWTLIPAIVSIIEAIMYASMSEQQFTQKYST
jgi:TM2 domain-containing membrane protein YozV